MANKTTFFLGRVHKVGILTHEDIAFSVTESVEVTAREYKYSFINAHIEKKGRNIVYVYGEMAKYSDQGSVEIVEPKRHRDREASIENKKDVGAAFVYIPEFEGIAYQRFWNKLTPEQFINRFGNLVSEKFKKFFANVEIEPIADLRVFAKRISNVKSISKIDATVTPPNPLFGIAWESLKKHLAKRNLKNLQVREEAKEEGTITTGLIELLRLLNSGASPEKIQSELTSSSMADQAVLMSADGYGKAKVKAEEKGGRSTWISTRDSQHFFEFEGQPTREQLFEKTYSELKKIKDDRYMEH